MSQYTYLTQGGYERIKADVEELRTNGRKEAARAIAEARENGDLSENAEYDAAKDAQGLLEAKIAELESKLGNARIIDETMLDDSKVGVLTNVTIENVKLKKQVTYKLVPGCVWLSCSFASNTECCAGVVVQALSSKLTQKSKPLRMSRLVEFIFKCP